MDEKANVNADCYTGHLLPELIAECKHLLPAGSSSSKTQNWLQTNGPGFIRRINGLQSPDFNPLDYYDWDAMLEKYYKLQPKSKTTDE